MLRLAYVFFIQSFRLFFATGAVLAQITSIDAGPGPFFPGPLSFTAVFDNNKYALYSLKWEVKCMQTGAINSNYVTL